MVPTGQEISGFPEKVRKNDWSEKVRKKSGKKRKGSEKMRFQSGKKDKNVKKKANSKNFRLRGLFPK